MGMPASKLGARYMILAVIFFALAHASVKALPHLAIAQLVFLRQSVALVISLALILRKGISPWGKHKGLLLARGLLGTLALSGYFYSLHHMPLASAVTLQFLSPVVTLFFAQVFLKEPASLKTWFAFLLAFFGVLLVKGFDARISNFELAVAMGSVLTSAAAYTSVRALKATDHELVIVFYFPLVTIPLIAPFAVSEWVTPVGFDWIFIFVIGVFTFLAQLFMTMSYQRDKAGDVGIYNYLGILIAFAIGYLFFDERFAGYTLTGMATILVAVFLAGEGPKLSLRTRSLRPPGDR